MDLDTAKHVAEQTLLQAQNLMRENKFLEPIFLSLTNEDVTQDWPQMEIETFEGYEVLIEKHLPTAEAMVMLFQSLARDLNDSASDSIMDVAEDPDHYHCLVCIVHIKGTTAVLQSLFAEENGEYVFLNNSWEVIKNGFGKVFDNPY